jgi:hypothetical protein
VSLGVAALFSTAALAGADCAAHKTQAAVDKTEVKEVATAPVPDKMVTDPVQTAQASQQAKSTPAKK